MNLSRREALSRLALLTGGALVGAEFFLTGTARADKSPATAFTADDRALLDEIGETILPATDTPGAKAIGIGAFMAMIVTDCYDAPNHRVFQGGLAQIDAKSRERHGQAFLAAAPEERTALLNELHREERSHAASQPKDAPPHYFHHFRQLTLLGYFTSEIGCTQALRYIETPGSYHGDVPYRRGDRAWVNPSVHISYTS